MRFITRSTCCETYCRRRRNECSPFRSSGLAKGQLGMALELGRQSLRFSVQHMHSRAMRCWQQRRITSPVELNRRSLEPPQDYRAYTQITPQAFHSPAALRLGHVPRANRRPPRILRLVIDNDRQPLL